MKKQFVTYEIAKALKELGFNEPCLGCYTPDTGLFKKVLSIYYNDDIENTNSKLSASKIKLDQLSAPLWQQVIDWLREEKRVNISIEHSSRSLYVAYIGAIIVTPNEHKEAQEQTYTQARESAILKALEILKVK